MAFEWLKQLFSIGLPLLSFIGGFALALCVAFLTEFFKYYRKRKTDMEEIDALLNKFDQFTYDDMERALNQENPMIWTQQERLETLITRNQSFFDSRAINDKDRLLRLLDKYKTGETTVEFELAEGHVRSRPIDGISMKVSSIRTHSDKPTLRRCAEEYFGLDSTDSVQTQTKPPYSRL